MSSRKASLLPASITAILTGALVFAGCAGDASTTGDTPDGGDPSVTPGADSGGPGTGKDSGGPGPGTDSGPTADTGPKADGPIADGFGTIFTIVMENHDYNEIVGNMTDAPFVNSLIASYGLATQYMDSGTHPSLPNYLQMISGDVQYPGLIDLEPTQSFIIGTFPVDKENLGTQLQAAGVKWRAYDESMGAPCVLASAGTYATKHDPFLYFKDMQTGMAGVCAQTNVDYGAFAADMAGGTYKYMWITPNLNSDGHDPAGDPPSALKASDDWAKAEIGKIMASTAYKNNGVIFLVWDEAEGRNGNSKDQVPMVVISPKIVSAGFKSAVAYSHKSYLATVEDILKLPRLATVTGEASMMDFFKK